jgi:hypothetical protein
VACAATPREAAPASRSEPGAGRADRSRSRDPAPTARSGVLPPVLALRRGPGAGGPNATPHSPADRQPDAGRPSNDPIPARASRPGGRSAPGVDRLPSSTERPMAVPRPRLCEHADRRPRHRPVLQCRRSTHRVVGPSSNRPQDPIAGRATFGRPSRIERRATSPTAAVRPSCCGMPTAGRSIVVRLTESHPCEACPTAERPWSRPSAADRLRFGCPRPSEFQSSGLQSSSTAPHPPTVPGAKRRLGGATTEEVGDPAQRHATRRASPTGAGRRDREDDQRASAGARVLRPEPGSEVRPAMTTTRGGHGLRRPRPAAATACGGHGLRRPRPAASPAVRQLPASRHTLAIGPHSRTETS